ANGSGSVSLAIEQGERLAIAALAKLTDPDPFAELYPDDPMVRARELPAHPDHLQLANAVCDSADALRERLQSFRSSLHTKLKLPHCAPHKEAITDHAGLEFWLMSLRLELTDTANMSSVAGCLEASWAFVSSEWTDRDQLQQDALALASSYPDDKATLILHCLGHQCANHGSASALQPFLMLIAGVNQSFSRYLVYLEQFGDMGDGAMLASMVFLLEFSESILDMIGTEPRDAYTIVEGQYNGQLQFTQPLTDHPAVAVVADDIATFVMYAHRFGESYQQCTNPSLDEASQQLWAQEAHKAYAKVTAVGVSSLAIQRFLHPDQVESDRYPQIGEQLTTQLNRIQEGIEAKLAGMLLIHGETAPTEVDTIDPTLYQTKLASALKGYDEAIVDGGIDFGLEVADISAAKAFKGYRDLAQEDPAGLSNIEKADRVKTIAGMNKDAMDATLNLLEGVQERLSAKAAPLLMAPETSARGLRMSHAANQAGQAARRLTPIFQKGMLGMDIVTVISATAVMTNSEATWSERTDAGFDLAAGLVGTAESIGVLAGASWAAAGAPLTILIAYFKMMHNVFRRMESSRQLSLYRNRLELLGRLAIGSAKAASNAQTTLAAAQAESTGAAQTQMSAVYAEQTRLAFRVIGRHLEESSSTGWDAFEAVYDHWSDWSEEQDDLRDALQGDAFKKLTANHVTPETIASHHHTVLNDVKGIMERLETKLDQAEQGGSSKD
ncbi:MAG: hypothetical protein AAFX99_26465, partial [Myxococcota bacterium]